MLRRTIAAGTPLLARAASAATAAYTGRLISKGVRVGVKNTEARSNTYQHDAEKRYQRRPMPRRKKRRWVRFTKKVKHVTLQMQPLQVYTQEGTVNVTSAVNQGNAWSRMLGGIAVSGNDEILQSFQSAYNVVGASNCYDYRLYLKSICMDVEVTNNGSGPVIIDVYTIAVRKPYDVATSVHNLYSTSLSELAATPNGGTVTNTKTALTPFDAPNFTTFWRVLKKTEYIIGAGNTVTLQLRSAADKYIEGKSMSSSVQGMRGLTKAFLFTWHGQPTNHGTSGAAQFDSTALTFGWQTVVHYAVSPSSTLKEAGRTD